MKTQFVGILNLTPDSFSDGSTFTLSQQLERCTQFFQAGAAVIDIGAESTRPGAVPLTDQQEWARLEPVLATLIDHIQQLGIDASLDTRHPQNAGRALALGIDWINDVSGLSDPQMLSILAPSTCRIVVMHSLRIPADRHIHLDDNCDPIESIKEWWADVNIRAQQAGIAHQRLIADPGLGFGKTFTQCWNIINRAEELKDLGVPLYIGHSRKGFLAENKSPQERDPETYHVTKILTNKQIDYLRVHDVSGNRAAALHVLPSA